MTETLLKENQEAVESFYAKPFKFSYSSLNKLLYSPQSFFSWYILGEKEDKLESYLIEGKVIHCLLLEKDMFDEQFIVMPGKIPSDNTRKVIDSVFKLWLSADSPDKMKYTLSKAETAILDCLKEMNLHQSLKEDSKRLDKIITPDSNEYFEFLKRSQNKVIIDKETYDRCAEVVDQVRKHEKISELMRLNSTDFELEEVHNEIPLEMDLHDCPFGLKGIIDNLVINHNTKKVYVNDVKTTSKSLVDFPDTVEYYRYWMQAVIYTELVKSHFDLYDGWEIIFHFVVIDKYNHIHPIKVSKESLLDWQIWFNDEVLKAAKYHYNKKDYTLPYKFATDQVIL